jgi:DNA-directed RNA polymerase subunit RPC12/RpoP
VKATKKLCCPECGSRGPLSAAEFTEKDAGLRCRVCNFHLNHDLVHDFRCPFCIAHLWLSWLRAIRILLFHSTYLRSEEPR